METEAKRRAEDCDISRIQTAFDKCLKEGGIKWPKLRLDKFVFKPAGANSRNVGAIYVTENKEYLGKVQDGQFFPTGACSEDQQKRIIEAASDPAKAAKAYGQRVGQCSVCGRELTNAVSIANGIGPICASRFGF